MGACDSLIFTGLSSQFPLIWLMMPTEANLNVYILTCLSLQRFHQPAQTTVPAKLAHAIQRNTDSRRQPRGAHLDANALGPVNACHHQAAECLNVPVCQLILGKLDYRYL